MNVLLYYFFENGAAIHEALCHISVIRKGWFNDNYVMWLSIVIVNGKIRRLMFNK